jgi:hypothetical protein
MSISRLSGFEEIDNSHFIELFYRTVNVSDTEQSGNESFSVSSVKTKNSIEENIGKVKINSQKCII